MLSVVPDPGGGVMTVGLGLVGWSMSWCARGVQRMLAEAVQAEVGACLAWLGEELSEHGHRLVVGNGYHQPWEVTTTTRPGPR
jgi:hypothetical protein